MVRPLVLAMARSASAVKPKSWLVNVELVATPTSASYLNRIECHFQPLREFVFNAADYASHADVARALRRYIFRRNSDHRTNRIRLLESGSRVA